MALLDVTCVSETCGALVEIVRRAADYGTPLPPCQICGAPVELTPQPPRTSWTVDPVVVYKDPVDGSFRFPGETDGRSCRNYDKLGMQRIELRGAADVRRFERAHDRYERSREALKLEREHAGRELQNRVTRGELFRQMKTFSNMGRAVAQAAIDRGNARPQPRTRGTGSHFEVYSFDRSNRDESRGADGRRRRD